MLNLTELLAGDTRQMSSVIRYSSIPHGRGENVAEHSFYVAFYCLLIARDLLAQGFKIDMERLLTCAIIHDLDEAVTGDIIRTVKYSSPELKHLLERIAIVYARHTLAKLESGAEKLFDYWKTAKDPLTTEGQILQLCDMLSVISYCIERIRSGNEYMRTILRGAHDNFLVHFEGVVFDLYRPQLKALCAIYTNDAKPQTMLTVKEEP